MKFAIADPPYLGSSKRLYGDLHPEASAYDEVEAHRTLINRLCADYEDGWALCLHSPSLKVILNLCPDDIRVSAWVKPFAAFKPNVNPAYAWEPVIWRGGRKRSREQDTTRDWLAENITMQRGFPGAKPRAFGIWIMDLLNVQPGDIVDDIFPGSGAVQAAIDERLRVPPSPLVLWEESL